MTFKMKWEHWLVGLCMAGAIAVGLLLYTSTGRDDAHITFWPAYTLAERGALLNYSGERLEQSSTLSFVLWLALVYKLSGWNIVDIAYLSGMVFLACAILATYAFARKLHPRLALTAALGAGLSPWLLYWSFSKMEMSLVAALLMYSLYLMARYLEEGHTRRWQWARLGAVLWLLAAVRPEMPLILGALSVGAVVALRLRYRLGLPKDKAAYRRAWRRGVVLCWLVGAIILSLFAFRYAYFGKLFPQPVYAKVGGGSDLAARVERGVWYISDNVLAVGSEGLLLFHLLNLVGWGGAVYQLLRRRLQSIPLLLAAGSAALYGAYIVFVGGDWMENGRFIAHMQPLLTLFIGAALLKMRPKRRAFGVVALALLLFLVNTQTIGVGRSTGTTLNGATAYYQHWAQPYAANFSWSERTNRINARDIPISHYVGRLIDDVLAQGVEELYILSGQQGLVSYYIAATYGERVRLTIYDRYSLVSDALLRCAALPRIFFHGGSVFRYELLRENAALMRDACGLNAPDIIFDIKLTEPPLEGYQLYYRQEGWLPTELPRPLPFLARMRELKIDQSIYVRAGLLPPDFEPIYVTAEALWQQP